MNCSKVYPRTHGGTYRKCSGHRIIQGSIPVHTGEPRSLILRRSVGYSGSIPVHTGEPLWDRVNSQNERVYPRTHGGTYEGGFGCGRLRGLSPYTRGNQYDWDEPHRTKGSIPVHTGEPLRRSGDTHMLRVYPRTHGGTFPRGLRKQPFAKVYPRTHGGTIC